MKYPFKIITNIFIIAFIVCFFNIEKHERVRPNTYQIDLRLNESFHQFDSCTSMFLFGVTRIYVNRYAYKKYKKQGYVGLAITLEEPTDAQ